MVLASICEPEIRGAHQHNSANMQNMGAMREIPHRAGKYVEIAYLSWCRTVHLVVDAGNPASLRYRKQGI